MFVHDIPHGFNGLGKDNCKTRRDTFKFGILCILYYRGLTVHQFRKRFEEEQYTSHHLQQQWQKLFTYLCISRPRWIKNLALHSNSTYHKITAFVKLGKLWSAFAHTVSSVIDVVKQIIQSLLSLVHNQGDRSMDCIYIHIYLLYTY